MESEREDNGRIYYAQTSFLKIRKNIVISQDETGRLLHTLMYDCGYSSYRKPHQGIIAVSSFLQAWIDRIHIFTWYLQRCIVAETREPLPKT